MKADDSLCPEAEGMQSTVMYQALKGELKLIPLAKELMKRSQPLTKHQIASVPKFFDVPPLKFNRKRKTLTPKSDTVTTKTFTNDFFEDAKRLALSPKFIEKENNLVEAALSRTTLEFGKKNDQQKSLSAGNQRVPYTSTTLEKELSLESLNEVDFDNKLNQRGSKKKTEKCIQPKKHQVFNKESKQQNKKKTKRRGQLQRNIENVNSSIRQEQDSPDSIKDVTKNAQKVAPLVVVLEQRKFPAKGRKKDPSKLVPTKKQPKTVKIKRKQSEEESSESDETRDESSSGTETETAKSAEEVKRIAADLSKRFNYSDMYKLSLPRVQYIPITQVKRQQNQLSDVEIKMRMDRLQESALRVEALLPKWSAVVTAMRDNDDVGELRKTLANARVILNSKVQSVKKMMQRSLAKTLNTPEEKENVEYHSRLVQLDIDSLERHFELHEKNLKENLDNPKSPE